MCNRCGKIGHVAVACNQTPNYGPPNYGPSNYGNFQGPGTWSFQPTGFPGSFHPVEQPQVALPAAHRPLALPPSRTPEQPQNYQNVRTTQVEMVPSAEMVTLRNELTHTRAALASAQAKMQSTQTEVD